MIDFIEGQGEVSEMAKDKKHHYDEIIDQSILQSRNFISLKRRQRKLRKLKWKDFNHMETSLSNSSDLDVPIRNKNNSIIKDNLLSPNHIVALDCEMVGVGETKRSALARVSIVNYDGTVAYDQYVKPNQEITDYRTRWSGIRKSDMLRAISMQQARKEVLAIIHNKLVVGHALKGDFEVLQINLPSTLRRDTAKFRWLRQLANIRMEVTPSLKTLATMILHKSIQNGEHCSVEDARTAMELYRLVSRKWESDLKGHGKSFMEDKYWPMKLLNQTGSINNA